MDFYLDSNGEHRFFFADSDFDSIEEAEKCILRLITVFGCKVIIGDPLQNIIGNKTNEEQRSFMLFLEKIKKKYGVLILLGTHTRKATSGEKSGSDGGVQKEDSIEGSGSISKSASLIIIFYLFSFKILTILNISLKSQKTHHSQFQKCIFHYQV